jgi:hypothetical protein
MGGVSVSDEPHVPVITYFLKKFQPVTTFELGCSASTTPILETFTTGWVSSYHSSIHSIDCLKKMFRDPDELQKTDLVKYDHAQSLIAYLMNEPKPDFAVIGGPVEDRLDLAQHMVDSGVKCIILLNYDYGPCNYRKIRDNLGYDSRVFNNFVVGGETGVMVLNTLKYVQITDHV